MPLYPFNIAAGVNTEKSDKDIAPQWKDGNRIRFYKGYPETLGGWEKENEDTVNGVPRKMISWVTIREEKFIGVGTHKRLYVWQGGTYTDITPLRDSTSAPFSSAQLSNPFSTTAASDIVDVAHTGHGCTVGDGVSFSGASASPIDGITVDGAYEVISVTDANTYTIQISTTATNSEASFGGATVDYDYQINVGNADSIPALGWNADAWGDSTWGTIRTTPTEYFPARTWQLDQWGEDLIANVKSGAIYVWDSSVGIATPAAIISGAPATARFVLLSNFARHLIGFGVHDGSADDALLIQWSTSEDYTDWDLTSPTNSAGELRIDRGTEIVGAIRTRGQILVLTDISAHSLFDTGGILIFGIDLLGEGCGLISPNAVAEHSGIVYWMSYENFYIFDGVVREMPCDVWSYVFKDINKKQSIKSHAALNVRFSEVQWFYCSENSDEIDRYVKYNWEEKTWDYGQLNRTAWVDSSEGAGIDDPYAFDENGVLYIHEQGVNADGSAMGSFIESHDKEVADGGVLYHIRKLHPDFDRITGSVDVTLNAKKYPQSTATAKGPYIVNPTDERISVRARGRQISMKIESDAIDDSWRMGTFAMQAVYSGGR